MNKKIIKTKDITLALGALASYPNRPVWNNSLLLAVAATLANDCRRQSAGLEPTPCASE
jgi:hypothetical protein